MHLTLRLQCGLFFSIFLLLPPELRGQELITGYVLDAATERPLAGVTVRANTGSQALSDTLGFFSLPAPVGTTGLHFSHIGYRPQNLSSSVPGQVLRVLLQPSAAGLQEVVIRGYESNRPLLQTAGALSLVGREVLERFAEESLVRAVNTVPGVRMEERATASYRLSIRGSTLRSPYGIRNVKMYLDGIPLTEANGTTALNLLDAANIDQVEILKGPAGSLFGAGTGGTILLTPRRAAPGERQAQVGAALGAYGFRRYTAGVSTGSEKANWLAQYTQQRYGGYREQSAMDRQVLWLSGEFYPSEKRTVGANIIYSDLYYELPGGLTQEQYEQNPRQARGGLFGSVRQHASMNLEGINVGLKQEYRFTENFSNTTSLYGLHRFKDHPFNTDYERNTNQELGGRTHFVLHVSLGAVEGTFTLGGEMQRGFEAARTYDNKAGTPDSLRTDDEVTASTGLVFAQAELELPAAIVATAAVSLNDTRYEITRLHQVGTGNYRYARDFKAVLSPRVALLKQLSDKVTVHGSVSAGFSPPTEEEILTSDGFFNQELEAERGTSYELGIRGFALGHRLSFDIVGFYFKLKGAIVSRQEVSSVAVFSNVGTTNQKGLEASLGYTLVDAPAQPLSQLKAWATYTFSHFRFGIYEQNEADFSGNKLTGVAPHTATAGLDLRTKPGLYLNLTASYVDEIPLDDANTVFTDPYLTVGARVGVKRQVGRHLLLEAFGGAENLTDTKYSLGNDLNAFGGRYFQPAADRNYYAGLNLSYKL